MSDSQEDIVVERYESAVLVGIGVFALVLGLVSYRYIFAIIGDFSVWTALFAEAGAIVVFILVGIASYRRYRRFPLTKKYFLTFLYSIALFPIFAIGVITTANCLLDSASPVRRNAVIVDKRESHSTRKGRRRDYYYLYVQSWRPDLNQISVRVGSLDFDRLREGDRVTVRTRPGFLGLEWLCE